MGYGDIVPTGNLERYVAILCMTFSVTIFAYLMGAVSSIFGTVCTSDAYVASMKQNIDDMLRDRQVIVAYKEYTNKRLQCPNEQANI